LSSNYSSICTPSWIPFNFALGVHPFMNEHLPIACLLMMCLASSIKPQTPFLNASQIIMKGQQEDPKQSLTQWKRHYILPP
jgi:hypothetical protein